MRHLLNGFLRIFTWGKYPNRLDAIRLRIADKDADAKAIASDWEAVGDDLRRGIEQYVRDEKQYNMKTKEMLSRMKTGELESKKRSE